MRVIPALAVVLASIAVLRALLASRGWIPGVRERRLRIIEVLGLGSRQRLLVVEVEGERLLLGAAEASITVLRELGPAPVEIQADADAAEPATERRLRLRRPSLASLWRTLPLLLAFAILGIASSAGAAPPDDAASLANWASALDGATEPGGIASTLQVVALLTLVSIAPSILLMATCFTRVVIVLAFLRQAIGVQHLPPNQVLVGLSLFVTLFVMAPVGDRIRTEALDPYMNHEIDAPAAAERAVAPVREFVSRYTREDDLALFVSFREDSASEAPSIDDIPLATLLPSYLLSELRTAFEIGFMLYLPFLVIDLVIASLLISMGMIVLPPIVISLPFKLMLFVLLDGWNLVIGSLLTGLGGSPG